MRTYNSPYLFNDPNVVVNDDGDVMSSSGEPDPLNPRIADWDLRHDHGFHGQPGLGYEKKDKDLTLEELQAKYLDGGLPSDDNRDMWRPVERTALDAMARVVRPNPQAKRPTIAEQNASERAHMASARRQRWGR